MLLFVRLQPSAFVMQDLLALEPMQYSRCCMLNSIGTLLILADPCNCTWSMASRPDSCTQNITLKVQPLDCGSLHQPGFGPLCCIGLDRFDVSYGVSIYTHQVTMWLVAKHSPLLRICIVLHPLILTEPSSTQGEPKPPRCRHQSLLKKLTAWHKI